MRRIFAALFLLCLPVAADAQEASAADREKEAVRRAVETYLYAEEPEERKSVIDRRAKIYSVETGGSKMRETPVSTPAGRRHRGMKERSRQRIVEADVTRGGACVKVSSDLSPDEGRYPLHIQYISLLKLGGEWKIVHILMPPPSTAAEAPSR